MGTEVTPRELEDAVFAIYLGFRAAEVVVVGYRLPVSDRVGALLAGVVLKLVVFVLHVGNFFFAIAIKLKSCKLIQKNQRLMEVISLLALIIRTSFVRQILVTL